MNTLTVRPYAFELAVPTFHKNTLGQPTTGVASHSIDTKRGIQAPR